MTEAAKKPTGAIALEDGTIFWGQGWGKAGVAAGELCFNTAMTGYQEILTDPSYAEQIVLFTFPHIGNVGANADDQEESSSQGAAGARGAVFKAPPTLPASWRSSDHLSVWLEKRGIVGLSGVDTRALTRRIRELGMPKSAMAYDPAGKIDGKALVKAAKDWKGVENADLAINVTSGQRFDSSDGLWKLGSGFQALAKEKHHVVLMDFGVKKNILRNLSAVGAKVTVVPAKTKAEDILALKPDGVVLSNGPGDPAATAVYAGPEITKLIASGVPILGICLGHQMLALALGAKTKKMPQGHHGANHPVKDFTTGKVEIVSMNHGFTVDTATLPKGVEESHKSLFDGTNCGLSVAGKPIISVQHHPEASPGPQDSFYLFERFAKMMAERQKVA
ncbi:MAG TPA: glutamine-hydrolyzing carbamoyl-phosphate synthase small subunit [Hyphomonadaceae bacterium]|jgi:carbamoyl-phosphate synthase small subunit|nr:glutamine-hydrolyzing carbamoyl-phosphate synthase small subunit [Hyphomonadaceae bacterium]